MFDDLFGISQQMRERLAAVRARQELERPLPIVSVVKVQFLPSIPYAGNWDGQTSFSRSICSGNYHFGAEVVGKREPVTLLFDNGRGSLVTRDGWRAVEDVHVAVWHGDKRREYSIPAGSSWVVTHLHDVVEEWGGVTHLDSRTLPQVSGQVDTSGRW